MAVTVNNKVLEIIFVYLLLLAVWLTYDVFTKKFSDYDRVTLHTSTLNLQLPKRADVKIRDVIVGKMLSFENDPDSTVITLKLYPDQINTIPADVTDSIVPKTLFGKKYVALEPPANPSPKHIADENTIEHTQVAIEVEKMLNDLYPLLHTVQPTDINQTLNAITTALENRDKLIGENLKTVNSYLKRLNPQIPAIVQDLQLTAQISTTYAKIMPEIAEILHNTIKTTNTLEDRKQQLKSFFADLALFSDDSREFLDQNSDNLIKLGQLGAAQLRVLAKYAPKYPYLTENIVNAGKRQAETFRDFTLHIVLETLPNQPRGYNASDVPRLGKNRNPACLHLPNPP